MIKVCAILLFLTSCGDIKDFVTKDSPAPPKKQSDETLLEYVEKFEDLYGIHVDVPINFSELEINYAGMCTKWTSGYAEIEIDPVKWEKLLESQKEQLVFHELGHCVFDRGHDDTSLDRYCPTSIMRSFMFNQTEIFKCYNSMYDYYISELNR